MNIFVSFVGYYELPLVIELPFALSVARHACLDEKKFPENTVKRPFFFKKKTKPRTYFSEARKISKKKRNPIIANDRVFDRIRLRGRKILIFFVKIFGLLERGLENGSIQLRVRQVAVITVVDLVGAAELDVRNAVFFDYAPLLRMPDE